MAKLVVRPAERSDVPAIVMLANLLNRHEGLDPTAFTEGHVEEHGFGDRPAFSVRLAEREGVAVGYALFHDCYNSELPARGIWLVDLFVVEQARGQGIGHSSMAAVAKVARQRGAASLWWGVRSSNRRARTFYAGLGAKDDGARILELNGEALIALAEACDAASQGA